MVKIVGGITLGPLLAMVFFSSDSAFNGSGRTAKWIQSILPSAICAKEMNWTLHEAQTLWFRYFDTWALPKSHNRVLLQTTYAATYTARMVYYLTKACAILCALSLATLAINHWVFGAYKTPKDIALHAIVAVTYGLGWFWLVLNNKNGRRGRTPTGAWKRLDDVFGRSMVLLRNDVLKDRRVLSEALDRVEEIRKQYS